jgi:prepilin-type N-terminal cleavage/methylation domain-containing protein
MCRIFLGHVKQRGFTFNEILVAMALTSVVVLGYSATITTVIRGNRISESYTIAVSLAQDKVEQLRSQIRIDNESRCPGDTVSGGSGGAKRVFRRCWEARDWTLGESLKELRVSVSWNDSETRAVTVTTLVYQE